MAKRTAKVDPYLEGLIAGVQAICNVARDQARTLADHDKVKPAIALIDRAPPHQRVAFARHVIARCGYPDRVLAHACAILAPKPGEPLHRDVAIAIMHGAGYDLVKKLVARANKSDRAAIAMLWELLMLDERKLPNEYHASYVKEFALDALGVRLLDPENLGTLLGVMQKPGYGDLTNRLWWAQLSPWDRRSILKHAKPQAAFEISYAMTAMKREGPSNDPAVNVVEALRSPALDARLAKAVARDPARKKRYAAMIEYIDNF